MYLLRCLTTKRRSASDLHCRYLNLNLKADRAGYQTHSNERCKSKQILFLAKLNLFLRLKTQSDTKACLRFAIVSYPSQKHQNTKCTKRPWGKRIGNKKSIDTNNNTIMYTVTIMKTFIEPYNIMWFWGRCIWMVGISPFSWICMNIEFWIQYLNKHAAGNVCGRIQKKLFWFVRVLLAIWDSEYVLEGVLSNYFSKMVILTKAEQHAINTELQTGLAVRSSHANWA